MIKDLVFMFLGYQAAITANPEFFTGIEGVTGEVRFLNKLFDLAA